MKIKIINLFLGTILIFLFAGCKKNIFFADRNITGKWVLKNQETNIDYHYNSSVTFNPVSESYIDSYSIVDQTLSENFDGTIFTINDKYSLETSESGLKEVDTTFTYNYTLEITFYDDGTGTYKEFSDDTYFYFYEEFECTQEYSFYWNWIDNKKDKAGIEFIIGEKIFQMIIENLNNKELSVSYKKEELENEISNQIWTTYWDEENSEYVDIYRKWIILSDYNENTSQIFEKK